VEESVNFSSLGGCGFEKQTDMEYIKAKAKSNKMNKKKK
jgi:hypothetical protein